MNQFQNPFKKGSLKVISIVYFILRFSIVLVIFDQLNKKNYENIFLCLLTLILFLIPSFIEKRVKIEIPDTLEIIILLFIYSAEILGEIQEYYILFPYWDTLLHTLNGFLCAAIGFSLIDILNKSDKIAISLSPVFVALMAFCFSMTIGVVWELFEFSMDQIFNWDMQKDTYIRVINSVLLNSDRKNVPINVLVDTVSVNGQAWDSYIDIGLIDTITDLFVNFIGAVVFSIFGYFYIKHRGKNQFLNGFILKSKAE